MVGAQKLVPTLQAAHSGSTSTAWYSKTPARIAAYGQHSSVGKIVEIHQELPGRIHIVLVREMVGF